MQEYTGILVGRMTTDLANTSAFLYQEIPDLNWVGFYLREPTGHLALGPFQGRVACTDIHWGRGVCGTAAAEKRSVLVPDVHVFPGHIVCDPRSRSELVIPLISPSTQKVVGVLDLDSALPNRFSLVEQQLLEKLVQILLARLGDCWP